MASTTEVSAWFAGRVPQGWFTAPPEVTMDRDEILITGEVPAPDESAEQAEAGRIARFRQETREHRIEIAREAEQRFGRKVAWAARCRSTTETFTTLSVPMMTRLRQPERVVLDTLVDAGVARSRSHALAWCVRLVGQHADEWLGQLREALQQVEELREAGPATS